MYPVSTHCGNKAILPDYFMLDTEDSGICRYLIEINRNISRRSLRRHRDFVSASMQRHDTFRRSINVIHLLCSVHFCKCGGIEIMVK